MTSPVPPVGGPYRPAPNYRGLIAAIACIAVFGVSQSMTHPLFALLLERQGLSSLLIGVNGAMPAVAALTLAPFMPRLIARMGLPPFLAVSAIFSAFTLLLFPMVDSFWIWTLLRYLQGAAATALFVGSESWIVSDAEGESRGRIIGLYGTTISLGFAMGPLLLTGVGLEGWTPFVVAAAGSALCILPLATAWDAAPDVRREKGAKDPVLGYFARNPTILGAVILFGAVEFGAIGLIPVWGVKTGMDAVDATFLVAILTFGGVVFQIPLGALADKVDRRTLLAICGASCVVAALLTPLAVGSQSMLWLILFLWGGLVGGLYTISLIELGARYRGSAIVSANAAVVVGYGLGSFAAPPAMGGLMDGLGPNGLFIGLAALAAAYLLVLAVRSQTRRD